MVRTVCLWAKHLHASAKFISLKQILVEYFFFEQVEIFEGINKSCLIPPFLFSSDQHKSDYSARNNNNNISLMTFLHKYAINFNFRRNLRIWYDTWYFVIDFCQSALSAITHIFLTRTIKNGAVSFVVISFQWIRNKWVP
jgi:hypothetical protein